MATTPIAAIDIGTNTTLLLIASVDGQAVNVLYEQAEITRLGRGIGNRGDLQAENIERTLNALRGFADIARRHGARIVAVGTEGLRRATNSDHFLVPAERILGTAVEVIPGDREAELVFAATVRSFPDEARGAICVIDIGGGSTEFILATAGNVVFRRSLPLGSVRLHEQFLHDDPPSGAQCEALVTAVQNALGEIRFTPGATLIGTAGTVTTLCAMALSLSTYDPAVVHGHRLPVEALDLQIRRLAHASTTDRQTIIGLDPKRADVILAGALLLRAIVRAASMDSVLVSDRGVRWGLLFETANSPV
ncbi:MAG: Ppx/GppA phosphatase family protein [Deltaproteobacteria bacterium]|nr:Ppx/GppA phosphatase family protein [Deltaproteobacteria bacterium]